MSDGHQDYSYLQALSLQRADGRAGDSCKCIQRKKKIPKLTPFCPPPPATRPLPPHKPLFPYETLSCQMFVVWLRQKGDNFAPQNY